MIKPKDVIIIKVPYPSVSSGLTLKPHMYICKFRENNKCELIKCQTFKPALIGQLKHYCIENADIGRNPFKHTTLIDCDKLFKADNVTFDISLKTTSRPDICEELFLEILKELNADGTVSIELDKQLISSLNQKIKC